MLVEGSRLKTQNYGDDKILRILTKGQTLQRLAHWIVLHLVVSTGDAMSHIQTLHKLKFGRRHHLRQTCTFRSHRR